MGGAPISRTAPEMLGYVLKRCLATIPVMVIVAVLVFLLLRLAPGDPAAAFADLPQRFADRYTALFGVAPLDEPLLPVNPICCPPLTRCPA